MNAAVKVVALEEHFWIDELREPHLGTSHAKWSTGLGDLADLRLREMDAARIDVQVISHCPPAAQNLPPSDAVRLARRANDVLHEAVLRHRDRFAAFAILPTPDPKAAADELTRTVEQLGFKGAMIHGLTHGRFSDEKPFWPIYERAQALDVPIYLHPSTPHPAVADVYYKGYPSMMAAGWGYTAETAAHAIRLVMSGLFDAYPRLAIIVGHLGESLPFSLWRCDQALSRSGTMPRRFQDYFRDHFYLTTSGNFSYPALLCSIMEMGVDRIMFSVDWPYASNTEARDFIDGVPLAPGDKVKILGENATRLLRL
jgi:predicted TIM-barrel fold metal-dependent hydrolase